MRKTLKDLGILMVVLTLSLSCLQVFGLEVHIERQESGDSFVEYPQLALEGEGLRFSGINAMLLGAVAEHMNTLTVLQAGTSGTLQVTSQAEVLSGSEGEGVLAVLFTAEGRMPNGRSGYRQTPLMLDLDTNLPITASTVFTDLPSAKAFLEQAAQEELVQDLSNYLDVEAILPFPVENLLLSGQGIHFFYPEGGLTWLSGRQASLFFYYHELESILNFAPGSLLNNLGIQRMYMPDTESAELIRKTVQAGSLPGLDAVLGGKLEDLINKNKLKYDPEGFPGGQSYHLEADVYREVLVLSRDNQTISGILAKRMNLFGLVTDHTTQEEARGILGEPDANLEMDQALAELYSLSTGETDTYFISGNQLRLHYDPQGILRAIWLQTGQ